MKLIITIALSCLMQISYGQKSTADQIKSLQTENYDQAKKIKDLENKIIELQIDLDRIRTYLVASIHQKDSLIRVMSIQTSTPAVSSYSSSNNSTSTTPTPEKTTNTTTTSSQCNGITKKGTRCLRMVKGGGNCYQH